MVAACMLRCFMVHLSFNGVDLYAWSAACQCLLIGGIASTMVAGSDAILRGIWALA